ncbi:hypothetical protein [Halalkalibacter nanhaiisediminis]|uniref:Lipoprotein n=1 Tax=Halalkalibacter nanhaiisediminis TaxID=688079 RepID=A0A562QM23_9BACI|nr:hypothetical protein [Halalkalibacter nanhaiisediminis]TWI57797.1 hypothetical protein IQ10_01125 [Halalkalibacter nanhaiisediminis]
MNKRKVVILSFLLFVIVGCTNTDAFTTKGESESWESTMQYSITKDYEERTGTIKYNGDEQIKNVSYKINFPSSLGIGSSGNLEVAEGNQKIFSLGKSGGNNHRDIQLFRDVIHDVTITVSWVTDVGEYEETISFSQDN